MSGPTRPQRRIGFLAYEGMAASDILWEVDMFRLAPVIAEAEGLVCPGFETVILGLERGPVRTWAGFDIVAEAALGEDPGGFDMLYLGSAAPVNIDRLRSGGNRARQVTGTGSTRYYPPP